MDHVVQDNKENISSEEQWRITGVKTNERMFNTHKETTHDPYVALF